MDERSKEEQRVAVACAKRNMLPIPSIKVPNKHKICLHKNHLIRFASFLPSFPFFSSHIFSWQFYVCALRLSFLPPAETVVWQIVIFQFKYHFLLVLSLSAISPPELVLQQQLRAQCKVANMRRQVSETFFLFLAEFRSCQVIRLVIYSSLNYPLFGSLIRLLFFFLFDSL